MIKDPIELRHYSDMIIAAIAQMEKRSERLIIAISGPPASGKTTLSEAVVKAINRDTSTDFKSALLPMDGFHLDNSVLQPRGMLARKGAPETFDSEGFCRLVRRMQQRSEEIIYPVFDRTLDKAIAGAGVIGPEINVVVVEGNYLLMQTAPWNSVFSLYDLTVFITPSMQVLEERLVSRWLGHGYDNDAAYRKARENDLLNAKTILDNSLPGMIMISE